MLTLGYVSGKLKAEFETSADGHLIGGWFGLAMLVTHPTRTAEVSKSKSSNP